MYKVIFEDAILQANRWTQGIQKGEQGTQRISIKDLFDRTSTDQDPNDAKAPKILPYPLSDAAQFLSNIYVEAVNARRMFVSALDYPLIKEKIKHKNTITKIANRLNNIRKEIQIISKELEDMLNDEQD